VGLDRARASIPFINLAMIRRLLQLQTLALAIGTGFAFYTVVVDFIRFYGFEGTVFKVQDCVVPNPVTTPCFWGAFAFLVALVWSSRLLRQVQLVRGQRRLSWLLVASTIFAWGNFSRVAYDFYRAGTGSTTGCSGVLTTNPFTTPCFIGSVIFLVALTIALFLNRQLRHAPSPV